MLIIKGIDKSKKCWVRGDYSPDAAECKICPGDGTDDYQKCLKIYNENLMEDEMAKIILKKKGAAVAAPAAKGKAVKSTTKAVTKVKSAAASDYAGKEYKEGSGSWLLVNAVRKLKKANIEKVLKFVGKSFEAADPEGRAKHVLAEAVGRGLIRKSGDDFLA